MSLALSSRDAFAQALDGARDVALCAYTLAPGGAVARALERAATRGARVCVRLESRPAFGRDAPAGDTAGVAADLRAHGVTVSTSAPDDPPAHLKAAVVDGRAFLDDRNWATSGHETIVSDDDPADVAAVREAIAGQPAVTSGLALEKRAALAREVEAIASAPGDRIDVASESFGPSLVSAALAARARAGTHVRLEVTARALKEDLSGRERAVLGRLAAAGVEVRAVAGDEKFCLAGDRAWLGSANATWSSGAMSDWGVTTREPAIEADLAATFARAWATGTPITSAT